MARLMAASRAGAPAEDWAESVAAAKAAHQNTFMSFIIASRAAGAAHGVTSSHESFGHRRVAKKQLGASPRDRSRTSLEWNDYCCEACPMLKHAGLLLFLMTAGGAALLGQSLSVG